MGVGGGCYMGLFSCIRVVWCVGLVLVLLWFCWLVCLFIWGVGGGVVGWGWYFVVLCLFFYCFCVIIVVFIQEECFMVEREVIRDLVRMYLLMNKSDRWIAGRLGLSVGDVAVMRRDIEFLRDLREYEGMVLEGVRGCVGLFRDVVRGLVEDVGMDVDRRLRLVEVLLRYGGFGRLLGDVVSAAGSGLGGGELDRVYELGIGGVVDVEGE